MKLFKTKSDSVQSTPEAEPWKYHNSW